MAQKVGSSYRIGCFPCSHSQAVALVLGNWHNVLQAISMAASMTFTWLSRGDVLILLAKIPKPKDEEGEEAESSKSESADLPLPQTLVRIPTEQAPLLEQAVNGNEGS